MNTRWILTKESDGNRGQEGKKKIYEVSVNGKVVELLWGMFEKGEKQFQKKVFPDTQSARFFAWDKVHSKQAKGYTLVASA